MFAQATRLALDLHKLGYWEEIRSRFSAPATPRSGSVPFTKATLTTQLPVSRLAFKSPSGRASSAAAWLLGPEGQEVRTAVERLWQSLLPEPPEAAAAVTIDGRIPEGAMSVATFREHLEKLAKIGTTVWPDPRDYYPGIASGSGYDLRLEKAGDVLGRKIRDGYDTIPPGQFPGLAKVYGGALAAARSVLGEQGMRERMVTDPRIEFGPQELEAYLFHIARRANASTRPGGGSIYTA